MGVIRKSVLSFFFIVSIINVISSQTIDQKSLISIIYLQSNEELNKEIKSVFNKSLKKKKEISYQISNEINFIDVEVFIKDLECCKENLFFDFEVLNSKGAFKDKYSFEAEKNNFKEALSENIDLNNLIIHFSKPIENLLVIELSDRDFSSYPIKQGKALKILFLFDKQGLVERVFTKALIYN